MGGKKQTDPSPPHMQMPTTMYTLVPSPRSLFTLPQTEHARLIKIIGQSEQWKNKPAVVCDMMAGVGPFAVPLAKNGHRVFANDLNPDSYSALRDNGFRNKVAGRLTTSNECGRAFARKLIRERQVRTSSETVRCVYVFFLPWGYRRSYRYNAPPPSPVGPTFFSKPWTDFFFEGRLPHT